MLGLVDLVDDGFDRGVAFHEDTLGVLVFNLSSMWVKVACIPFVALGMAAMVLWEAVENCNWSSDSLKVTSLSISPAQPYANLMQAKARYSRQHPVCIP